MGDQLQQRPGAPICFCAADQLVGGVVVVNGGVVGVEHGVAVTAAHIVIPAQAGIQSRCVCSA